MVLLQWQVACCGTGVLNICRQESLQAAFRCMAPSHPNCSPTVWLCLDSCDFAFALKATNEFWVLGDYRKTVRLESKLWVPQQELPDGAVRAPLAPPRGSQAKYLVFSPARKKCVTGRLEGHGLMALFRPRCSICRIFC